MVRFGHWQQEQLILATTCRGLPFLLTQRITDNVANGYFNLVGNAIRQQASSRSKNKGHWDFRPHVKGFLLTINRPNPCPTWECIEVEGVVGFRHIQKCSNIVAFGQGQFYCEGCNSVRFELLHLCRMQIEHRDSSHGPRGRIDQLTFQSPTLVKHRLKQQSHTIDILKQSNRRRKDVIA